MKKSLLLLLALAAASSAAQNLRLTPYESLGALYADLGRVFNYNRYEQARFELGLTYITPSESWSGFYLPVPPRRFAGQWTLHAYAAYGTRDRELKGGATAQFRYNGRRRLTLRAEVMRDLELAGNRKLEDYQMLATAYNTAYVASRYLCVRGAVGQVSAAAGPRLTLAARLRQTWEDRRFDSVQRLFPAIDPDEQTPLRPFTELGLRADWKKRSAAIVTLGRAGATPFGDGQPCLYLRTLAQYDGAPWRRGPRLFGQAGFASARAPYSRLFDLSGSGRAPYFFRNTFLTVPVNRFMANAYAYLFAHYTPPRPLWNLQWTRPYPFAQAGVMWGVVARGRRVWEGMPVAAPDRGLLEAAAGFEGLLRWGVMVLGAAVAYQYAPPQAAYRNTDPRLNFAVMAVATLAFDEKNKNIPPPDNTN